MNYPVRPELCREIACQGWGDHSGEWGMYNVLTCDRGWAPEHTFHSISNMSIKMYIHIWIQKYLWKYSWIRLFHTHACTDIHDASLHYTVHGKYIRLITHQKLTTHAFTVYALKAQHAHTFTFSSKRTNFALLCHMCAGTRTETRLSTNCISFSVISLRAR